MAEKHLMCISKYHYTTGHYTDENNGSIKQFADILGYILNRAATMWPSTNQG
jgi:hypothetical protein